MSLSPTKYQKKPFLNKQVFAQLVSGTSQRRCARLIGVNQKTVVRKFVFLGKHSLEYLRSNLHAKSDKYSEVVFDDMESFEHTKCKPLSISLMVEDKTRFILGFRVASMPAKGLLAKKAVKKYGYRVDERKQKRQELFNQIKPLLTDQVQIKSDESTHYTFDIKKHFPKSCHLTYKGRRGCVVGQGELKAGGYDPLFSLNHTAAMLRANINRLFRRTWNTTKKAERLEYHIALYAWYHNKCLIPP